MIFQDPPVPSIPPVRARRLSPADCEVSAQITGAKKQHSLGPLSRDKLTPILCLRECAESERPPRVPTVEEHTRGLIGFVYVLISSALDAQGAPREGRDHLLYWSIVYMRGVSHISL